MELTRCLGQVYPDFFRPVKNLNDYFSGNGMNEEIETRLHDCYPHGLFGRFDEKQANLAPARDFWEQLPDILSIHGFHCKGPDYWSQNERVVDFDIYRNGDPDYWYFSDNRAEKIAMLRKSGEPHVAISVEISTVIPAIYLNIKETWFNPETFGDKATGRYDDGLKTLYWLSDTHYEPWAGVIADLRALSEKLGLASLAECELKQDVPFITDPIFSDDDDDRDDLLGSDTLEEIAYLKSLPQNSFCLRDCLFSSL